MSLMDATMEDVMVVSVDHIAKTSIQENFEDIVDAIVERWQTDHLEGFLPIGKIVRLHNKDRRVEHDEYSDTILVVEKCIVCNVFKRLTPDNFVPHGSTRNDYFSLKSGKECYNNSISNPCKACISAVKLNKRQNGDPQFFCAQMYSSYPKLKTHPKWNNLINSDGTLKETRCYITNIVLNCKTGSRWQFGVQNNKPKTKGEIYNQKDHEGDYCDPIVARFNVSQYEAIQDLQDCWRECFKLICIELDQPSDNSSFVNCLKKQMTNNCRQNGVTAIKKKEFKLYYEQLNARHLPTVLTEMARKYIRNDMENRSSLPRLEVDNLKDILFKKLVYQSGKCFISGIPFVFDTKGSWKFWSLERLDNNKNHTEENTILICRMFNTAHGIKRDHLLEAFLTQILVPISDKIRMVATKELNLLMQKGI